MKENIKILLVSNMYPSNNYPNYGVFVKNTEDILNEKYSGIDKAVIFKQNSTYNKVIAYIKHYINIVFKVISNNYDLIYVHYASHNAIPVLISTIFNRKIKVCTNLHGSDVIPENKKHIFFQKFVKHLLIKSNTIIVPSKYYKEVVMNKYDISENKIHIFPSGGIDKNVFSVNTSFRNRKYIGYVGRIDYKKGWDVFLKCASRIKDKDIFKDYKFIVVGNGNEIDKYNNMVQDENINDFIYKYDMMSQKELNNIYNEMEVFCFPTMREGESLGLVGLEAMACGTPVIGSNIGGLKDYLINGYNGYLFTPGNDVELESCIEHFIKLKSEEKEKMRNNAISTADEYEVNNIRQILIDIFSLTLKE